MKRTKEIKGKMKISPKTDASSQSHQVSRVPSPIPLPSSSSNTRGDIGEHPKGNTKGSIKGNTKQASVPSSTPLPSSSADPRDDTRVNPKADNERAPKGNIEDDVKGNTKGDAKGDAGASTIWNGVKSVLRIAQTSLDSVPVPGLKSAIGGFLEAVSQLEKVGANTDAIRQLRENIEFFKDSVSEPLKHYDSKNPVPPRIDEAIKALSTRLAETTTLLQPFLDKNSVSRWANRDDIEGNVRQAGEKIRDAVRAFQASQVVQIHLGIKEVQKDIQIQSEVRQRLPQLSQAPKLTNILAA
ncbi:uncharacterized protein EI90DRAFT_3020269 [Cantharellus anzutake]|uniref:uncharacterized protein n=1 Tax=Cantharellus anzutake TaxID=1750568 RepID=UPI0019070E9E|nr:uncharacterized protein EI90DRAFT_3020269 [Cantharellus anzutake]KAF8321491.1 hypothetical protein EI90DRAFT_3020269 [Cantharellus anzutake]